LVTPWFRFFHSQRYTSCSLVFTCARTHAYEATNH
jgi:hypothetical protein